MGHGAQQNRCRALLIGMLLSTLSAAGAQVSLQQAMLRISAQAAVAGSDPVYAPSVSVEAALQQIAGQAAIIFTGSVAAVQRDSSGGARVRFTVERGVRGVASGSTYTMHVSAWAGGAERYYPGERALFLLTAPAASGYSAPVMGEHGVVPLTGDALVGNLDLRWIATDVARGLPASAAMAEVRKVGLPAGDSTAPDDLAKSQQNSAPASPSAPGTLPQVQSIDRDLVLDLLRASQADSGQVR